MADIRGGTTGLTGGGGISICLPLRLGSGRLGSGGEAGLFVSGLLASELERGSALPLFITTGCSSGPVRVASRGKEVVKAEITSSPHAGHCFIPCFTLEPQ